MRAVAKSGDPVPGRSSWATSASHRGKRPGRGTLYLDPRTLGSNPW